MKYASVAFTVFMLEVASSHAQSQSSKTNIERSPTATEAVTATAPPNLDPVKVQAADRILKSFAESAKTVNTFSVTQLLTGENESHSEFVVSKPNKISVRHPRWRDGPALTCDGISFSVIFPGMKSCVHSEAPQTLLPLLTNPAQIADRPGLNWYQALDFFPVFLTIDEPDAWLIRFADAYEHVGVEVLGPTRADHIRFYRGNNHWDLWLSAGDARVPLRLEHHDWQPPATFEFSNWKINHSVDESVFVVQKPPAGYKSHQISLTQSFRKLVGKSSPDFRLLTIDGRSVTKNDYRGKVLLLDFWATSCAPCQTELAILQGIAKDYPTKVEVLAVTSETKEEVAAFLKIINRDLPIAFDDNSEVANRYGVGNIPHLVTINPQGVIQEVSVGLESRLDEKLRKLIHTTFPISGIPQSKALEKVSEFLESGSARPRK